MRAVVITRPGGPEVLELVERPDPPYGPDEVLVRVRASALNRADLLQRRGVYPAPPGAPPDVPGLEFSGEIEACGAHATAFQPGDRVMGLVGGGGHAERIALYERLCLRIPPGMTFEKAAAVPEAFLTAYDALFAQGGLGPGEAVLVHAAGSGVGTAVALLATAAGGRVIGLARSPEKRGRLEALGLHRVLDPADPNVAASIRMCAGGSGVDLVIDFLGAGAWTMNVSVLAPLGRLVLVGTLSGAKVEVDLGALMHKRLTVVGTVLRSRPVEEKIRLVQAFGRTILPLLASGRIEPVVDRVVRFEEVARAHAAMERNENFGKIVLSMG